MRKSSADQHHVVNILTAVDRKADIVQITERTGRSA